MVLRNPLGSQKMLKPGSKQLGARPLLVLPGYSLMGRRWDDSHTNTFSAQDIETGDPVLIRAPKPQLGGDPRNSIDLRRDYEIALSLSSTEIIQPLRCIDHNGLDFLILQDDGTLPIGEQLLVGERLDLNAILEIGLGLAEAALDDAR